MKTTENEKRQRALFHSLTKEELNNTTQSIIDSYNSASNVQDLSNLISMIDSSLGTIDQQVENFRKVKSKQHQHDINSIELNRATKFSSTIENSNQMLSIFESANDLGNSLTTKIKSLDQEIGNVKSTLNFVSDIQLLKNNINQASYAIESKNYELAAKCISKISKLDPDLINGKFASVVIPSTDIPELPARTIEKWVDSLTDIFKKNFEVAANDKNVEELTKYFQLFPLIGKEEVGLICYSKFICKIIVETLKQLLSSVPAHEPRQGIYSNVTIQLFENISMMISQHNPLIKRYYGESYPNATSFVISKIQGEIDSQIGIIGDTLYDNRRIDKMLQDIRLYSYPILTRRFQQLQGAEVADIDYVDELVSVVQVGDIVNELATIFHHWSLYSKFIAIKYFSDSKEELELPKLIVDSQFTKKIRDKYIPSFETLIAFYFRRSLEKAISIEEKPSLDSYLLIKNPVKMTETPCSSVIEDVTLILNNTLRNVLECSIPSTVKKFISSSYQVIQQDLINGFFIKSLNENTPRYNQSLSLISPEEDSQKNQASSRSATPEPSNLGFLRGASTALGNVVQSTVTSTVVTSNNIKVVNFTIYLNSVAIGQEYFSKIFDNILNTDNYFKSLFPFGKDQEIVKLILQDDFLEPFNQATNKIISDSLLNLYNQSFRSKVSLMINEFFPESSESNYVIYNLNEQESTETYIKLSNNWKSLIQPYERTFHKSLMSKLLRLLVINVSNIIEKKLMNVLKKFKINELGAIKLERDLSHLINEVCQDNYHLREKFVRVTQIVLLVGMDDEEYDESVQHINQNKTDDSAGDENEFDETLGINWILTPQERKEIRRNIM